MALHLIKLAVGVDDVEHLRQIQRERRRARGRCCFFTRNTPRRAEEVLDGGSIYWVVKGWVSVRQRIVGIGTAPDDEGRQLCAVEYEQKLVEVEWRSWRPFQGWRYLLAADAPPDRRALPDGSDEPPPEMARALRELGLL